jgi:hypothetical protein
MPKFRFGMHANKMRKKKHHKMLRYLRFSAGPLRGQYVHRIIAAAKLGRDLEDWETVDHEDGNTLNDDWRNLSEPISREEHGRRTQERLRRQKEEERKVPF